MKKSTILLLVVVYILSFFVIGLLGNSVRSYDPVYEPESIELSEIDGKLTLTNPDGPFTDADGYTWDYWYVYHKYVNGSVVRINASVKPDNSTYPYVSFVKDAQNTDYSLDSHETDENIEENIAILYSNVEISTTRPAVTAKFTVISQNPGVKIQIKACIVFALY